MKASRSRHLRSWAEQDDDGLGRAVPLCHFKSTHSPTRQHKDSQTDSAHSLHCRLASSFASASTPPMGPKLRSTYGYSLRLLYIDYHVCTYRYCRCAICLLWCSIKDLVRGRWVSGAFWVAGSAHHQSLGRGRCHFQSGCWWSASQPWQANRDKSLGLLICMYICTCTYRHTSYSSTDQGCKTWKWTVSGSVS